jgi:hypothetical protein
MNMANPFDQFDAKDANPFDRFDAPEVATKAEIKKPSNFQVMKNKANQLAAGVPDAILNLPANFSNLVKAGVGAVGSAPLAALTGRPQSDFMPALQETPDMVNKALTTLGYIRPEHEPVTQGQRYLGAATQGGLGMLLNPARSVPQMIGNVGTGVISALVGEKVNQVTGSPAASIAAQMLTPSVVRRAASVAENTPFMQRGVAAQQDLRDANIELDRTRRTAVDEGYKFAPSALGGRGRVNSVLESIAGKGAIAQDATTRNQQITTRVAKADLPGFPQREPLTLDTLEAYRAQQAQPYREVARISPQAAQLSQDLRDVRDQTRHYFGTRLSPEDSRQLQQLQTRANVMEMHLETMAQRAGRPDLLNELRQARTNIAKSHDVQRALNLGDASVSAPAIGGVLNREAPLSGGLQTIGRTQQAIPLRPFMGSGSSNPDAAYADPYMLGRGLHSAAHGDISGMAVGGGIPFLKHAVRPFLLSDAYQRNSLPQYQPNSLMQILQGQTQQTPQQRSLAGILAGYPSQ